MIETKIQSLGVGSSFQVLHDRIITPGGGLIIFVGMQDATAESIKVAGGFQGCVDRRSANLERSKPVSPSPDHSF
jgi:hypothetical protein